MKRLIIAVYLLTIFTTVASQAQTYTPDWDFLERMQAKANAQYESGLDNVSGNYHYLRDLKLINRTNKARLAQYMKQVDEYMHRSSVASLDYSKPANVSSTCSVINAYRGNKYIMDEINLLSDLYGELSRLKTADPENYTRSHRYNEIIDIFKYLENCKPEDIDRLRWQKPPAKQEYASSTEPKNAGDYSKLALEKWKTKDFQASLQLINKSIELAPNYAGSYNFRACIYLYDLNNYDEAVKDFTRVLQMTQGDKVTYYRRGYAYTLMQKKTEAIQDLSTAINIDPNYLHAYFDRALLKTDLGDRQGAMTDYDQIIKRENLADSQKILMATVYNNKGYCLVTLGRYDQALPFLNKAIQMGPNENYIWGSRGELYYKTKNYSQCISDMDMAIELLEANVSKAPNLGKGTSYYYRGMAKIKIGKQAEACKDLSRAGELGSKEAYDAIKQYCK